MKVKLNINYKTSTGQISSGLQHYWVASLSRQDCSSVAHHYHPVLRIQLFLFFLHEN